METDKFISLLQRVQPIEPPPYLLTRIRQRIATIESDLAPVQLKWSFILAAVFILLVNTNIAFSYFNQPETKDVEALINTLHISSDNNFYNE